VAVAANDKKQTKTNEKRPSFQLVSIVRGIGSSFARLSRSAELIEFFSECIERKKVTQVPSNSVVKLQSI
jgi:hypothetical protein